MKKIRIGNDIGIRWEIFAKVGDNISPYDLTDKRIDLYVVSPYRQNQIDEFIVDGNAVEFTFLGMVQKYIGRYHLLMVENDAEVGMHTVDECDAFELVRCSCDEGGDSESRVEIANLSFSSAITIGGGGGTSITIDTEMSDASENPVQNKVIKAYVDNGDFEIRNIQYKVGGLGPIEKAYNADTFAKLVAGEKVMVYEEPVAGQPRKSLSIEGYNYITGLITLRRYEGELPNAATVTYTLTSEGDVTKRIYLYNQPSPDGVMSDTSTNAVQNKAIKAYVDASAEMSMPLSRDFSNDFNNDFAI